MIFPECCCFSLRFRHVGCPFQIEQDVLLSSLNMIKCLLRYQSFLIWFLFLLFKCLGLKISVRNFPFLPLRSLEFTNAAVVKAMHYPQGMTFQFALFSQLGCNCYFTFWMGTFSGGLTASALLLLLRKVWNWSACSVFLYELVTGMNPLQWSKCSVSGTSEMFSFTWHQQKR